MMSGTHKKYADKKRSPQQYNVRQEVYLSTTYLQARQPLKKLGAKIHRSFPHRELAPILIEGEQHFEVKEILDSHLHRGKLQHLTLR